MRSFRICDDCKCSDATHRHTDATHLRTRAHTRTSLCSCNWKLSVWDFLLRGDLLWLVAAPLWYYCSPSDYRGDSFPVWVDVCVRARARASTSAHKPSVIPLQHWTLLAGFQWQWTTISNDPQTAPQLQTRRSWKCTCLQRNRNARAETWSMASMWLWAEQGSVPFLSAAMSWCQTALCFSSTALPAISKQSNSFIMDYTLN